MKRIIQPLVRTWAPFCMTFLMLFTLSAFSSGAAEISGGRTLVNGERLLFGFILLPHQAVEGRDLSLEEDILILLRDHRNSLRMVAPEGMVPIPDQKGVLLGYFAGDSSAVSFRVARIDLEEGTLPVRVDRSQLVETEGGRRLHLSPWDIPAWPEAIFPDGLDDDWEEIAPIRSFSAIALPEHLEIRSDLVGLDPGSFSAPPEGKLLGVAGDDIASARFWRLGGTMIRHLYSYEGRDSWFLALRTEERVLDNTGYHFQISPNAELVVLVDGRSGPVVYRRQGEHPQWAGQYTLNNRFVEIQLDRRLFSQALAQAGAEAGEPLRELSLVTSHRTPSRVERFYLSRFPIPPGLRER
ncbi:hypothetical protein SAMN05920897_102225 [Alkalispirochaeta americana]|uniref:Uncharacterized protein n=1 Tax=Alkalispirochaeta americana TaxID=159291 RepID=A0A1N6PBQ9_9SPIO|nr:hypothetical protein [Alkalispirochaeta americana]SIQ01717.1 hypothetical protein SAMN05920897_102225 [Alkalispirochaeta americana]